MMSYRKAARFIREKGLFDAAIFSLDRLRNQLVTRIRLKCFNLRGIYIGRRSIINGVRYIVVGDCLQTKDMIWIDAISRYGDQHFMPSIKIGNRVSMSRNVHIAAISSVFIGDDVMLGSNVLVSDHSHGDPAVIFESQDIPPLASRLLVSKGDIYIGNNVWIGDGVVILSGVEIGDYSIIGANSVVTNNIPARSIAFGNPARVRERK
jgi:lipopolysaccharide O-acetyltransferase